MLTIPANRLLRPCLEQGVGIEAESRIDPRDVEFAARLAVGFTGIPHDPAQKAGKAGNRHR